MTVSYRGNKNEQLFKHFYVFGGRRLKINNYLVVFQLNTTKVGQMPSLNVVFHVLDKLDKPSPLLNLEMANSNFCVPSTAAV